MDKPFSCRLGWHRWVRRSTEDGTFFKQCARCGKDSSGGRMVWLGGSN